MFEYLSFDLKVSGIHDLGEKFGNLEQMYTNGLNKKTSNSNWNNSFQKTLCLIKSSALGEQFCGFSICEGCKYKKCAVIVKATTSPAAFPAQKLRDKP